MPLKKAPVVLAEENEQEIEQPAQKAAPAQAEVAEAVEAAEPEPVQVAEPAKAVAVASSSAVAARPATGSAMAQTSGKFEERMASEGFGGLEVGFYSYTVVKLETEGTFATSEKVDLGKSLKVQLMESKAKYAYGNSDDEDKVEFSYDRVHNTKNELLDPILNEWKAEGASVTEKKYLDVTAMVVEGDLDGEIIILSVSPSGVAKFTGYMGKLTYKGLNPRDVVTEVFVGPKVTTVKKPFYPWAFRLAAE